MASASDNSKNKCRAFRLCCVRQRHELGYGEQAWVPHEQAIEGLQFVDKTPKAPPYNYVVSRVVEGTPMLLWNMRDGSEAGGHRIFEKVEVTSMPEQPPTSANLSKSKCIAATYAKFAEAGNVEGAPLLKSVKFDGMLPDEGGIHITTELNTLPRVIKPKPIIEISVIDKKNSTDTYIREHGSLGVLKKGKNVTEANQQQRGRTRNMQRSVGSRMNTVSEANRIRVLRALVECPHTCDELEIMLSLPHQTCSAVCRYLSKQGFITQLGAMRPTRAGGRAGVWFVRSESVNVVHDSYVVTGKTIKEEVTVAVHGVDIPLHCSEIVPEMKIAIKQAEAERLWYRAEITGGTDANPEIRTTIRMLWRGAVCEISDAPWVTVFHPEAKTRSERYEYAPGFRAIVSAGGHITAMEPAETLEEMCDNCIDFLSDTQLSTKAPEIPLLEFRVEALAPNIALEAPRVFVFAKHFEECLPDPENSYGNSDDFKFSEIEESWELVHDTDPRCDHFHGVTAHYRNYRTRLTQVVPTEVNADDVPYPDADDCLDYVVTQVREDAQASARARGCTDFM